MAVTKTDFTEVSKFISDVVESGGIITNDELKTRVETLNVKQVDYLKFMKSRGITEETVRQVASADIEFNNGVIIVAKDRLLEDPELTRVVVKARTPEGIAETRYTRKVTTRAPKTGTVQEKYGVVSFNLRRKSRLDKDLIDQCSLEIEKAFA